MGNGSIPVLTSQTDLNACKVDCDVCIDSNWLSGNYLSFGFFTIQETTVFLILDATAFYSTICL